MTKNEEQYSKEINELLERPITLEQKNEVIMDFCISLIEHNKKIMENRNFKNEKSNDKSRV